jgi:hypothetical protein
LSATQIRDRVRSGVLISDYRGVYRAGHRAPSTDATYMAAVKACGDDAAITGLPAAHLLVLIKGKPPPPEVTAPTKHQVPGLKTRRSRLAARDVTEVRGIPVTTVARTIVDLAATLPPQALALACHEAGGRHRTTPREVAGVLERRPNAPGAAKLRAVMWGDTKVSLSRLESRFLSLLRAHNLPLPITNKPAGGRRVDCRWPEHRLTVELDSYRFHNSRHACEQDRARERQAYARGDEFRRYTPGDVSEHPRQMLAELRMLTRRAGLPPGRG